MPRLRVLLCQQRLDQLRDPLNNRCMNKREASERLCDEILGLPCATVRAL